MAPGSANRKPLWLDFLSESYITIVPGNREREWERLGHLFASSLSVTNAFLEFLLLPTNFVGGVGWWWGGKPQKIPGLKPKWEASAAGWLKGTRWESTSRLRLLWSCCHYCICHKDSHISVINLWRRIFQLQLWSVWHKNDDCWSALCLPGCLH